MTTKEVGEMIRTRRISRGMTQEELASAIGVTASAIGLFENGKRRPKDEVAEALADVFNIPKWAVYFSEDEITAYIKNVTVQEDILLQAFRAADETAKSYALEILLSHPAEKKKDRA